MRNISLLILSFFLVVRFCVGQQPGAPSSPEESMLSNGQLRLHLRTNNLTLSVEDLTTHTTWGSDPWENSAGRIHVRGKQGETVTVGLGAALNKNIEPVPATAAEEGFHISLSDFRSRMGPVREDRDPGAQ
ncbi:MAG: hypothetical protein JOZ62_04120, partial [Acidobacteriaceae bacterium]|nr:hypothetical protein [Acidobacteriaceae bacterium]